MTCTCGGVKVGGKLTGARNWNHDCVEHGVDSAWYNEPEQVAKREAQWEKTATLQLRARMARVCPNHTGLHCPTCQSQFQK